MRRLHTRRAGMAISLIVLNLTLAGPAYGTQPSALEQVAAAAGPGDMIRIEGSVVTVVSAAEIQAKGAAANYMIQGFEGTAPPKGGPAIYDEDACEVQPDVDHRDIGLSRGYRFEREASAISNGWLPIRQSR